MSRITVQLSNQLAATNISLCLDNGESYSISRFPRSLLQDEDYKKSSIPLLSCQDSLLTAWSFALETRQNQTKNSNRWVSRTPSQQTRRKNWTPPELTQESQHSNTFSRYSKPDYVLGDSSPVTLGRFSQLFNSGSNSAANLAEPDIPNVPELSTEGEIVYNKLPDIPELSGQPIYELDGSGVEGAMLHYQTKTYVHRSASKSSKSHDGHHLPTP